MHLLQIKKNYKYLIKVERLLNWIESSANFYPVSCYIASCTLNVKTLNFHPPRP